MRQPCGCDGVCDPSQHMNLSEPYTEPTAPLPVGSREGHRMTTPRPSRQDEHDPMPGVSKSGYAINVLYTTASRLRAMCDGGDWDLGLREAAAFIEFKVVPEVRDA